MKNGKFDENSSELQDLPTLHNRCYQRQEITHREESSDSEGTMCYANGSSKWHTPAYYPLIYFKTYV